MKKWFKFLEDQEKDGYGVCELEVNESAFKKVLDMLTVKLPDITEIGKPEYHRLLKEYEDRQGTMTEITRDGEVTTIIKKGRNND